MCCHGIENYKLHHSCLSHSCHVCRYGNWSPEQRDKFRRTIAQIEQGPSEEDLLYGMTGLGLQQGTNAEERILICNLRTHFSRRWSRHVRMPTQVVHWMVEELDSRRETKIVRNIEQWILMKIYLVKKCLLSVLS